MDRSKQGNVMAATAQGLYIYDKGSLHQVTNRHTLSVLIENENHVLTGEVGGVHRHYRNGKDELLSTLPNVIKMEYDDNGTLWVLTVDGDVYSMAKNEKEFKRGDSKRMSILLDYTDRTGRYWSTLDNGQGVQVEWNKGKETFLATRVKAFKDFTIQTVHADSAEVWLGGDFGMIRMNLPYCDTEPPYIPKMYLRHVEQDGRYLEFTMATDFEHPVGKTLYSYRLKENDKWTDWGTDQTENLYQLSFGDYELRARCMDAYGNIVESETYKFHIPFPFYLSRYALMFYLLVIGLLIHQFLRFRTRRIMAQNEKLEETVKKRTKQVIEQKNEIEQKSHELEKTLVKLRDTQSQLIRQEREATVGKLIRGLVDRILNPMNYINNFSHLTRELVKDLREDVEDEKESMNPDTYEDSVDVLDMMKTNLEKIEQHGISTTRTLKAMEEMLKERSQKFEPTDLALLCQQCVDKFKNYFPEDISRLGVQVVCEKPDAPVMRDVVPELMGKAVSYMLSNSMYAVKKKAEKGGEYSPVIRVTIAQEEGRTLIKLYDNGIGIEAGILDKIFDPFFTTKPTAEAPGVGLYLCQQIMHDCGGNITVTSVKDEYTEFVINFL